MKHARVFYRQEDGAWIGTSPDVPGYVAWGDTYEQARDDAADGMPWFAEEALALSHVVPLVGDLGQVRTR